MSPGRELDALIAEKVMAWSRPVKHEGCLMQLPPNSSKGEPYSEAPNYSTDIAAAWEVVKKLRSMGLVIHDSFISVDPDSAPHAICLAALKVMGMFRD